MSVQKFYWYMGKIGIEIYLQEVDNQMLKSASTIFQHGSVKSKMLTTKINSNWIIMVGEISHEK